MESKQRLLQRKNEIITEVRKAYDAVLDARDAVDAHQKKLEQTLYQEQATRRLQQTGASTLDHLLEQENVVLSSRTSLIQARYKVWNAYADLLKAAGRTKPHDSATQISP
jgi:outer membrane protein TolC